MKLKGAASESKRVKVKLSEALFDIFLKNKFYNLYIWEEVGRLASLSFTKTNFLIFPLV